MAGSTACASYGLYAVGNRSALAGTFLYMSSVEGVHIKVPVREVDAGTLYILKINICLTVIFNAYGPCDQIKIFHYTVIQMHIEKPACILQGDDQGVGTPICAVIWQIDGRQPGKIIFSLLNFKVFESEFTGKTAVRIAHLKRACTVISAPICRIFLGKCVQGVWALVSGVIGVAGEAAVRVGNQIGVVKYRSPFTKVGME